MKVIAILIVLCLGATSSALYGTEVTVDKEWWNADFYLKFNSPSGKTFYIQAFDGTIFRERDPLSPQFTFELSTLPELPVAQPEVQVNADQQLPFISFVSIDFKIYDIYFDGDKPRLEKRQFVYETNHFLFRHRLESFVGPNKKVYEIIYSDGNELEIAEKSPDVWMHFQIKTLGPYKKWEHTYDFSEDGTLVLDHTISAIPVQANRSISLPELEPNSFIGENSIQTFVKFNSPSGMKYRITSQADIVSIRDDEKETAYITFTELNGRTYDIHIDEKDGTASLVEQSAVENYFGSYRLHSFVTSNRILYQIDRRNESDHEVPILVSQSSDSSDLHITFIESNRQYNNYVKYIFSDNGKELFDRVDDIDWTPLNELPAVPVEEVTADYVMSNLPFLTLYTSSGNNYHIFTTDTNASIAVERGARPTRSLYISYFYAVGRKTNIHFVPGADPYFEEGTEPIGRDDLLPFQFVSFTTPDHKDYAITSTVGDDNKWKPSIKLPLQVTDPIDILPVNDLALKIQDENGWQYVYHFTWNGDKLVEASFEPPRHYVDNKVLQSLVGK